MKLIEEATGRTLMIGDIVTIRSGNLISLGKHATLERMVAPDSDRNDHNMVYCRFVGESYADHEFEEWYPIVIGAHFYQDDYFPLRTTYTTERHPVPDLDWRKILSAYIDLVGSCEGIDFLPNELTLLTDEEKIALYEVALEGRNSESKNELVGSIAKLRAVSQPAAQGRRKELDGD